MDFTRPERCRRQRTGREDRHSKFYEISDNLLTGETRDSLLSNLPDQPTLTDFDVHDLHVVAAAAQIDADAICTTDGHFQEPIGKIEIYRPQQLAREFGLLT